MISLPKTQALNSSTFQVPQALADDALALPELYDWHSEHSPKHPLFVYENAPGSITTILWPEAVQATHRAAYRVSSVIEDANLSSSRTPVVAILAAIDTITYFCFVMGVIRAGYAAFPISPRNNPLAISHLLKQTGAVKLFVSPDPVHQALASAAIEILRTAEEPRVITTSETPVFQVLFPPAKSSFKAFPPRHYDMEAPALILHSSGSTTFPKPITWNHRAFLVLARIPLFGEIDLCGRIISCHAMPMFHGMGALQLGSVTACGVVMSVFKPSCPATIPSPQNVFEGAVATRTDIIACVPAFIEAWSRNPEYVAYMKNIRGVVYGGGPFDKERGNFLASQGVNIYINYGCTEVGPISSFLRTDPGMDWEYFSLSGHILPELLAYPDGTYELIVMKHVIHVPCVLNTKIGGVDGFQTSDLLRPHPTRAGLWKILGRADDQIMLSTGEKTNPGPLETILCQDPHVQAAVMFGRGQFQNGVIIDPSKDMAFDPKDETRLVEFRNAIWPTVERLNAFAPAHSRLFKEMILVASPSKPFTYTAKATARRQAVIADYGPEISALYKAVAETTQVNVSLPADWGEPQTVHFVRGVVNKVLMKKVDDEDDIFQNGCDSLQATWVRNSILHALRETDFAEVARRLPENVIYQCPTVSSLASFVSKSVFGPVDMEGSVETNKVQNILDLLDKYSSFNIQHASQNKPNALTKGDVILLTGSTGGFGCNILAQLVRSDAVAKVYAVNRPSSYGISLLNRQVDALRLHGFDADAILHSKVILVESDLTLPTLGISSSRFEEIRSSITHIIHNAWRVDFNLSLTSFEDNIRGLKGLIDLALSSPHSTPPRLTFVSSIGVFRHPSAKGLVPESRITDPRIAIGAGYTESKWISEAILARATQQTPLRPIIVRLGQLTGDRNGSWNEREWFPSMVKSAVTLRCLPNLNGLVSWMPSYEAAAALIEMRDAPHTILHLVHPRPVSWTSLMSPIARAIGVPLVSYPKWLTALNHSMDDTSISDVEHMRRNSALRLIEFFRHADLDEDREPLGVARLDTTYAIKVSNTLNATMRQLDDKDAVRWIEAWRRSGFI